MTRKFGMWAAAVNACAVACFALCMLFDFNFGSYFVCIFIALSFMCMAGAFLACCKPERKAAGYAGFGFACMYAVLILLVYYAQLTTVQQGGLSAETVRLMDFQQFGLLFNYDMLGYGLMALSTFFMGLTLEPRVKGDRRLKALMLIHGIFFISCFLLPMLQLFTPGMEGGKWIGVLVLEFWCAYFIPVGVLSARYFGRIE